ncbi:S1C family serine protease [Nonlabens ponticola]|uniref:Trypsin-like serine protease n=1 Tax=Nonlabens ponticola TaxID=2496866 RepID=A0A3S9MXY0_9FLAO|nr:trypsin-like peptidase domain-containing protein [Nonlabens ponticola]AZQ44126.1 trypsin-like serine protease [Nonlabens ponticola]
MKSTLKTIGAAMLGGAIVLGSYITFVEQDEPQLPLVVESDNALPITTVNYTGSSIPMNNDFAQAAERTVHAVVHVKNLTMSKSKITLRDFYQGRSAQPQYAIGTGSGVIITPDGYIVTNNHVIDNSNELQVTLNNNRTYNATVVGTEPSSDIALIKIETDEDLPYVTFGDSDQAKIGEWVLAVGNPFNLTSTVTAGIVSAKGRDLNTRDNTQQSFIQTDAAVNPGNSGGALVNTRGELIGINTAIQSPTGSYAGYSFAVPSNNARKIIEDLMEYGFVQKGMLGISGSNLNTARARELGVDRSEGIYVGSVVEDSGAQEAGLREGDIIINIDGVRTRTFADLTGYIGSKNPGDVVRVKAVRGDRMRDFDIVITENTTMTIPSLEMDLRDLNSDEKRLFKVDNGVRIVDARGDLKPYSSQLSQFVITKINNVAVNSVSEVRQILNGVERNDMLYIEMKSPNGEIERLRLPAN